MFLIVIIIIFSIYVGIITLKQKMIYNVDNDMMIYPNNYKSIFINHDNKYDLHAWYINNTNSNKIIVFFHGNSGNISHRRDIINLWSKYYSFFIYDYPGYGLSKGYPTEKSLLNSSETIIKYILDIYPKENIILYGKSLGVSIASYVAQKYNMYKLINDSGFVSLNELSKDILPNKLKFLSYFVNEYNTMEYLYKYNGKIMILHSEEDEIIPYKHAIKMYNESKTECKLIKCEGTHNNLKYNMIFIIKFIEN